MFSVAHHLQITDKITVITIIAIVTVVIKRHIVWIVLLRIVIVDFIQLYSYNMNVNCDFKL